MGLESLSLRRVAVITLTIVLTLAAVRAISQVSSALTLIFISLLFATAVKPPVVWLEHRRVPRGVAIVLVYLVALAALILAGLLVFPPLVGEATTLVQNAPGYYQRVVAALTTLDNPLIRQINQFLLSDQLTSWATSTAGRLAGTLAGSLLDIGTGLAGTVFAIITLLTVGFYWINEQGSIERTWFSLVPASNRPRLLATWRRIEDRLGAYLRGLSLLCLVVGVLCGAGYAVLGVRYALVLGVIAAILEAVPTIGVLITAILVTLVALPQSPTLALLALGWTLVVQQVENTFLVPRVMGQAIGVSPLTLIVALLVFGSLLGAAGALLAVPLAAIVQIVVEEWVLRETDTAALAVETRLGERVRLKLLELRGLLRQRVRASDAALYLESGPDALLYQLELAVERALNALPATDLTDAATAAAWTAASDELAHVRALLEVADKEIPANSGIQAVMQDLEALLSTVAGNATNEEAV
ncbi:MAG: AI-2E family transporter [Anaerolineae bacterium]|nr:AI-2E family transporter [Anaerolineae bacterium]